MSENLSTLCLKNDTYVAHYNFDADQPIFIIIIGRDVAERVLSNGDCYPTSPNLSPSSSYISLSSNSYSNTFLCSHLICSILQQHFILNALPVNFICIQQCLDDSVLLCRPSMSGPSWPSTHMGLIRAGSGKMKCRYGRPTLSVYPSFCFFPFPLSFIFSFLLPFTFFPCSWDILPKSSYLDSTGAGPGRSWPTNDFWCNGSANVQVLSL